MSDDFMSKFSMDEILKEAQGYDETPSSKSPKKDNQKTAQLSPTKPSINTCPNKILPTAHKTNLSQTTDLIPRIDDKLTNLVRKESTESTGEDTQLRQIMKEYELDQEDPKNQDDINKDLLVNTQESYVSCSKETPDVKEHPHQKYLQRENEPEKEPTLNEILVTTEKIEKDQERRQVEEQQIMEKKKKEERAAKKLKDDERNRSELRSNKTESTDLRSRIEEQSLNIDDLMKELTDKYQKKPELGGNVKKQFTQEESQNELSMISQEQAQLANIEKYEFSELENLKSGFCEYSGSILRDSNLRVSRISPIVSESLATIKRLMAGQVKGEFTCQTTDPSGTMIICGTSMGNIVECDTQAFKIYKHSIDKEVITSVAISKDKRFIAAGSQGGKILYKRVGGKWGSKTVSDKHKRSIVALRFTDDGDVLVLTDQNLQRIKFTYYKLYIESQAYDILTDGVNLCQIEIQEFEGFTIVALASIEEIHLQIVKPVLEKVLTIRRPEYVAESVPCVSWCTSGQASSEKSVQCIIFWHNFLFMAKGVLNNEKQQQKVNEEKGQFVIEKTVGRVSVGTSYNFGNLTSDSKKIVRSEKSFWESHYLEKMGEGQKNDKEDGLDWFGGVTNLLGKGKGTQESLGGIVGNVVKGGGNLGNLGKNFIQNLGTNTAKQPEEETDENLAEILNTVSSGSENEENIDTQTGLPVDKLAQNPSTSPQQNEDDIVAMLKKQQQNESLAGKCAPLITSESQKPQSPMFFSLVGQKHLAVPILFGCALSNRVLAMVNSNNYLTVESIERYFSNSYEGGGIESSLPLQEDERPSDKIGLKTANSKFYPIFTELFKSCDTFMTFLGNDSAKRIRLLTLKELAIKHSDQGDWIISLRLCIDAYLGRLNVTQEEKSELKKYCAKLVGDYFNYFQSSNHRDDTINKIIKVSIDALVQTENFDYLFDDLNGKIDKKVFWEQVGIFILSRQIRKVPLSKLSEAADHLPPQTAQFLYFNQDHDEALIDKIVSISHRKKLNQTQLWFGLLNESTVSFILTHLLTTAFMSQANKKKPFWLLRRMLQFGGWPNERIQGNLQEFKKATFEWLYTFGNLQELFKLDAYQTSEILFETLLDIDLWSLDEKSLRSLNPMLSSDISENIMKFLPINSSSLGGILLTIIGSVCTDEFLQNYLFLCVKAQQLSTFSGLLEEVIWVVQIIEKLVEFPYDEDKYSLSYQKLSRYDFEEQVTRILYRFEEKLLICEESVKEMERKSEENGFYRIRAFFEELHGRPWNALNIFITQKYLIDNFYVFDWINKQFSNLILLWPIEKDQHDQVKTNSHKSTDQDVQQQIDGPINDLQCFCNEVIESIDKLILIDNIRTKSVVTRIPYKGLDTLSSLAHFPDLQINYLESLQAKSDERRPLDPDLKLAYIELLCKHETSKILYQMRRYQFPLEHSLTIVEKYQLEHPIAYIKGCLGEIEESFAIYTKLLMGYLEKIVENKQDNRQIKETLVDVLFTFECTIELCESAITNQYPDSYQYFYKLSTMLLKFYVTNFIELKDQKLNQFYSNKLQLGICQEEEFDLYQKTGRQDRSNTGPISVVILFP